MCRLLAVHRRGPPCPSVLQSGARGLDGFHHRAFTTPHVPGTSRTSPQRGSVGKFPSQCNDARGLSCRLSRATVSLSSTTSRLLRGFPRLLRRDRLCCLVWVVQRSPLHRSTAQESTPSTFRCLRGGGCHRALARPAFVPTSPFSRPRRLAPPARYRACTRPRSWGSHRFPRLRLPPPPRSPLRVSALRSLPPRSSLRPSLTRWSRRFVTPTPLPTRSSPNPFPPRSSTSSLSRCRPGTSRVSSFCGAVPPCAVASVDRPLLPWACQSCD